MISIQRRAPARATARDFHLPAPTGGLNKVDAGSLVPSTDCIFLYNMVASAHGDRVRTGYREWFTGLTGTLSDAVPTVFGFSGSTSAKGRLFATTDLGIFDVTTSRERWEPETDYVIGDVVVNDDGKIYTCDQDGTSDSSGGPTGTGSNIADGTTRWDYTSTSLALTFTTPDSSAGLGVSAAMVTAAGHFGIYCDETNGYHVYTESSDTWAEVANGSGASQVQAASGSVDARDLAFPCVHKQRLWLVEKDTAIAWYADTGAIYGSLTKFNFGQQFRSGGYLVGLWSCSYDGGSGMDDSLVAISSGGDVVIYQGTDPASASSWGVVGTWQVGGVVGGRRIATDRGGDLLIATKLGILPLSQLVLGKGQAATDQYDTYKIGPFFTELAGSSRGSLSQWALHVHPTDATLVVLVPEGAATSTNQLAMSLSTKAWAQYQDLPIYSACPWAGSFWFGTVGTESSSLDTLDRGRVCQNYGDVDNVQLSDGETSTPIEYSGMTAYSNAGNAANKQVGLISPVILSGQTSPLIMAQARYDYDLTAADAPSGSPSASGPLWGSAEWDSSLWAGEYSSSLQNFGAVGIGKHVAIAWKGKAVTRTVLVGFDLSLVQGGSFL